MDNAQPILASHRRAIVALTLFAAVSAVFGGTALMARPRGDELVPFEVLATAPFATFAIPGLLLAVVVGGTNLVAGVLALRRSRFAIDTTLLAGGALTVWMVAEFGLVPGVHWLQAIYAAVGVAILVLGIAAGWRSGVVRHRWLIVVTIAEAVGFMSDVAHRWIWWTALAWAVALPLSFLPGPLVDEATPIASHFALWGSGGLLMAFVMAAVTWQGYRSVFGENRAHDLLPEEGE